MLEPEEMAALREKTDSLLDDSAAQDGGYVQYAHRAEGRVDTPDSPFILRHTNELDRIYCDMLVREPILSLMET